MVDLARFKAIIFDFDGVIVDSETLSARAWSQAAREFGAAECEIHPARCAGRLDIEVAPELFPHIADPMEGARRKWQIEEELEAAGMLRTIPGLIPLLEKVGKTHSLAICSSSRHEPILERLEMFDLRKHFAVVTGRIDGVPHKPAADLYLRTLGLLKLSAEEVCAIEDSVTGVMAAKAAGIYAIQLVHEGMPRAEKADRYIEALAELMVDGEAKSAPHARRG